MKYTNEFKRLVVYKLLSEPGAMRALARDLGVARSTIWDWKREVSRVLRIMPDDETKPAAAVSPEERTPREKLRLAMEAERLSEDELGEFMRREGVNEEELDAWRDSLLWAMQSSKQRMADRKQVRTLERKLRKQEKLLNEANVLLELQKKVQAMWTDDKEDGTAPKSDS